jgi:glycerol-3-phosphate dehydrogenase
MLVRQQQRVHAMVKTKLLQNNLQQVFFRYEASRSLYKHTDVMICELGGALKNLIWLATGNGRWNLLEQYRAALITRDI